MEIFVKYGISSSCILPLTTAYGRLGSLCFISQSLQEYTAEEIRYLQLVTDQVALAVDNALRDVQQSREALFLAEGQKLGHIGNWARQVASGEVLFSQESLRMFGFREGTSRLALDGILSRVHPEDRAALQNTIEEASRQAADFESEFRTIRDDGSLRHIHVVGHPLENEQGRLAEFVGTHIDITEQYRSRKELEQALAEIRALKDQLYQKNLPCAKRWMRPQCLRTSSAKVKRCKKC
jgi:PAS domain S-box-containing protein